MCPTENREEKNEEITLLSNICCLCLFFFYFPFSFSDDTNIELDRIKILIGRERKQESSCGRRVGRVGWKQKKEKNTQKELLTVVLSHNR